MNTTCLSCKKYVGCLDPQKSYTHSCGGYREMVVADWSNISFDAVGTKKKKVKGSKDIALSRDVLAAHHTLERLEPNEFNLEAELDSFLKMNGAPLDFRIDDRDIPMHANFYEFCVQKSGMGQNPYPRQLAYSIHLFMEWCPHCSDPRFADPLFIEKNATNDQILNHVQLLHFGVCPKCGTTRTELLNSGELNPYSELAACVGQRAGKTAWMAGLAIPYLVQRWVKQPDPMGTMGLMRVTALTGTLTALTYDKAVELLWTPVKNALDTSTWFKEYHKLLDHYVAKYSDPTIYSIRSDVLNYRHRALTFHASGPNKRVMRGSTRILASVDEIGWYDNRQGSEDKEKASASEVYVSLSNSLTTVRKAAFLVATKGGNDTFPFAYALNISSPSSVNDKIMSLVRAHEGSNDVLTIHLPTWDFNPTLEKSDFAKQFRSDPVNALRDFGAQPPLNAKSFISSLDRVVEKCIGKPLRVGYKLTRKKTKDTEYRSAALTFNRPRAPQPPSVLAIDGGYSNNSFALSMGHRDLKNRSQLSALIEITPRQGQNVINFSSVYRNVMLPLILTHNVQHVVADRWQSLKLMHDVEEDTSATTSIYSMRYRDFFTFRDYLLDERSPLLLPPLDLPLDDIVNVAGANYPHCFQYKPVSHFLFQCVTVADTGRSIDKGDGYTDDLFRSSALLFHHLLDNDWVEQHLSGDLHVANETRPLRFLGVSQSAAGQPPAYALPQSHQSASVLTYTRSQTNQQ